MILTTSSSGTTRNEIKPVMELARSRKPYMASNANSTHTTDSGLGGTTFATTPKLAAATVAISARGVSGSHYSTDKSGSSGYYSSHVCSKYSLEEHIYCEPVIDIVDSIGRDKSKLVNWLRHQTQLSSKVADNQTVIQHLKKQYVKAEQTASVPANTPLEIHRQFTKCCQKKPQQQLLQLHYKEKLRNLETSIENLDRHLKTFQRLSAPLQTVSLMQQDIVKPTTDGIHLDIGKNLFSYNQLPTIIEGYAATQRQQLELDADDSLQDIDLDAFLLHPRDKQQQQQPRRQNLQDVAGIDNPSFLGDDQLEENNYKCAKYINSCPEDAYRVDNEESSAPSSNVPNAVTANTSYAKSYEDQLHFQSTRELLEDVQDKIRLLSPAAATDIPQELDDMIQALKDELETYLQRMNQHSELELRQLCSGLGRQQHVMRLQNAVKRRRSFAKDLQLNKSHKSVSDTSVLGSVSGRPLTIRAQIMSIRCASDPNFKMKRKSITDIFPAADCYIQTIPMSRSATPTLSVTPFELKTTTTMGTQMQRNLTFHKPVLAAEAARMRLFNGTNKLDSVADWHRKKPSTWEMYYGTNRLQQKLLGKQWHGGELVITSAYPTLSYPSSRPESDFTLDLPRAEQLRLKMEKEKKFRHRCRFITTVLSLVFFLLTVIVVSLVLTRGKRMFGSMI